MWCLVIGEVNTSKVLWHGDTLAHYLSNTCITYKHSTNIQADQGTCIYDERSQGLAKLPLLISIIQNILPEWEALEVLLSF